MNNTPVNHSDNMIQEIFQQCLWWTIRIPVSVLQNYDDQEAEILNTSDTLFSEGWFEWFRVIPSSFDKILTVGEQIQLSQKIKTVLLTPDADIRFTLDLQTDRGLTTFLVRLKCLIKDQNVTVWAQCLNINDGDLKGEALGNYRQSINSVYERQTLLEEQNKLIKDSFQKQSRFLALLSHELRSPLLGIHAMAMRLSERFPDNHELCETLGNMSSTVDYLTYLINDILTYSQAEFDSIKLHPHEFSIHELLNDVKKLTEDIASQKKLIVSTLFKGNDSMVMGDSVRLKQILINLVVNSIKFTQEGGVVIEVVQTAPQVFGFKVTDTGEGIPTSQIKKVFEPFGQVNSSKAGYQFGAGLGLFVVKQLIERMGGKIDVNSSPGVGTSFQFELNLSKESQYEGLDTLNLVGNSGANQRRYASSEKSQNSEKTEAFWQKALKTAEAVNLDKERRSQTRFEKTPDDQLEEAFESACKVLIAEDSDLNRMVLADLLEDFSCQVTETLDGRQAWETFCKEPFDLVILDIQMPFLSGIEVAEKISALRLEGKIPDLKGLVAITAGGEEDVFSIENQSDSSVFDYWLLKPVSRDKIQEVLQLFQLLPGLANDQSDTQESKNAQSFSQAEDSETIKLFAKEDEWDTLDQIPAEFESLKVTFFQQTHEAIDEIQALAEKSDWQRLAKAAHKLKGNMMLFQFSTTATWLKTLETSVLSDEENERKQLITKEFVKNINLLIKNLENS